MYYESLNWGAQVCTVLFWAKKISKLVDYNNLCMYLVKSVCVLQSTSDICSTEKTNTQQITQYWKIVHG